MDFEYDRVTKSLLEQVTCFMEDHIFPNVAIYENQMKEFGQDRWQIPPIIERLKEKAKEAKLWNFFLPSAPEYGGVTHLQYAPICELFGHVFFASEVFNCSAPDTGNMDILYRYGSNYVKDTYLTPLLNGDIRYDARRAEMKTFNEKMKV